jgi:hypothetical protein
MCNFQRKSKVQKRHRQISSTALNVNPHKYPSYESCVFEMKRRTWRRMLFSNFLTTNDAFERPENLKTKQQTILNFKNIFVSHILCPYNLEI